MDVHFILFVADQDRSTRFYSAVLDAGPRLFVPGMTEFGLGGQAVLGLMPEAGIQRLLGAEFAHAPSSEHGTTAELYSRSKHRTTICNAL